MPLEIDINSLIDIGFIVLVMVAVARNFIGAGDNQVSGNRDTWKRELKDLEETLRELIQEAGAASRNLDRNLLQRKRELESLLKSLDEKEQRSTSAAVAPQSAEYDLPNESWTVGTESEVPEIPEVPQEPKRTMPKPIPTAYGAGGLPRRTVARKPDTVSKSVQNIVSKANDTVSLSQQVTKEVLRQQAARRKETGTENEMTDALAKRLDESESKGTLNSVEKDTFQSTSIMDPATYKIARRLLASGKEIHVVARKVEMPVSEIRLLDRLMRQEQKVRGEEEDDMGASQIVDVKTLAHQIESQALPDARSLGQGSFSPSKATFENGFLTEVDAETSLGTEDATLPFVGRSSLDQDIERELALL